MANIRALLQEELEQMYEKAARALLQEEWEQVQCEPRDYQEAEQTTQPPTEDDALGTATAEEDEKEHEKEESEHTDEGGNFIFDHLEDGKFVCSVAVARTAISAIFGLERPWMQQLRAEAKVVIDVPGPESEADNEKVITVQSEDINTLREAVLAVAKKANGDPDSRPCEDSQMPNSVEAIYFFERTHPTSPSASEEGEEGGGEEGEGKEVVEGGGESSERGEAEGERKKRGEVGERVREGEEEEGGQTYFLKFVVSNDVVGRLQEAAFIKDKNEKILQLDCVSQEGYDSPGTSDWLAALSLDHEDHILEVVGLIFDRFEDGTFACSLAIPWETILAIFELQQRWQQQLFVGTRMSIKTTTNVRGQQLESEAVNERVVTVVDPDLNNLKEAVLLLVKTAYGHPGPPQCPQGQSPRQEDSQMPMIYVIRPKLPPPPSASEE
eukprot:GHVU01100271.1.p1 GENE.GHVU01100271.1~~GHVU01100271.1.p1  ORF type:complete len:488 (-),score=152.61 GHVU01100271.1:60-1379(-)